MGHRRVPSLLVAGALLATGCGSCDSNLDTAFGELSASRDGVVAVGRTLTLNLGETYRGESRRERIVLRNVGRAELTLSAELDADNAPGFFDFELGSLQLDGGSETHLDVAFAPDAHSVADAAQVHGGVLRIEARGERPGTEPLRIHLTGTAVSNPCALPKVLDFGPIERAETYRLALKVRNPLSHSVNAEVGPIIGATPEDTLAFSRAEPKGAAVSIPAQGSVSLDFEFRPMLTREYDAKVRLRASDACDWQEVRLKGRGTDEVVVWEPRAIDCGFVPDGLTAQRTLTFTNQRPSAIRLSAMRVEPAGEFWLVDDAGKPVSALELEGRASSRLSVRCKPLAAGRRDASLEFDTDVTRQPRGQVPLSAEQGGPDILVSPSSKLDFGLVGLVEESPTAQRWSRHVVITNVGVNPRGADVVANLRLGKQDAQGAHVPPYFELRPLNAATKPDELSVEFESKYDATKGIAPGAENETTLRVSILPATEGEKAAELTIYSNDLDEPEVKLVVTAQARKVRSCEYRLEPEHLDFGMVTPPVRVRQNFVVENLGTEPGENCLVSGASLMPGADRRFRVKEQPGRLLGPREGFEVEVELLADEAVPALAQSITGAVQVQVASATRPRRELPVSASLGPNCLVLAPARLDFGAVKPGCRSGAKEVTFQNVCAFPITVEELRVSGGAGALLIEDAPALPPNGLTLEPESPPRTVTVRYAPPTPGSHAASLRVTTNERGRTAERAMALSGRANELGKTVDRFEQRGREKVDLLVALAAGNSMTDELPLLEANFGAFVSYLEQTRADFHFAVVFMTGHETWAPRGTFWIPPEHTEAFLTPTTPELLRKVKEKFRLEDLWQVSRSGLICFENALHALLPPLSEAGNRGFLRADARLVVVCISDSAYEFSSRLNPLQRPFVDFAPAFYGLKNHQSNQFSLSVIAPVDPVQSAVCLNNAVGDGRYAAMVALTGGLMAEICTSDWSETLERVAQDATEYLTRFKLTATPDLALGVIEVRVNGRSVAGADANGTAVWEFEADSNEVHFTTSSAPEPGAMVEIEYVSKCQ